jgi:hypothetical protein
MRGAHGKESVHGKVSSGARQRTYARQRPYTPHGKEMMHGKGSGRCRVASFAVRPDNLHGKGAFAVRSFLCRAPSYILFVFLSILFHLILIFIFLISFTF